VLHGTASFELEPPDEAEMRRRSETITAAGYPYLVAEVSGRVVGYGYANAYRARPAYRYSVEDSIYVAPDWYRRGVGRALLAALIDTCTERGLRQMIAVIGDSDQRAPSVFIAPSASRSAAPSMPSGSSMAVGSTLFLCSARWAMATARRQVIWPDGSGADGPPWKMEAGADVMPRPALSAPRAAGPPPAHRARASDRGRASE
jgi:L-amino acid N-acyltransferase YncA